MQRPVFIVRLAVSFGLLLSARAQAQPINGDALLQPSFGFEETIAPWIALGDEAKTSLIHAAGDVKEGQGALRFDYAVRGGQINALILPTPLHSLEEMRALTFWIKADYPTTLAALFQEQDGGRYAAMFSVKAKQWQRVELEIADFLLLAGDDDPKDPNDKLDMGQVEGFSLADMGQLFAGTTDPKMADLLGIQTGSHFFVVDDLSLGRQALPKVMADAPQPNGTVLLEPLLRPQIAWTALGGAGLSVETIADLPGRSLQLKNTQRRDAMSGLMRRIKVGTLQNTRRLRFEATSGKAAYWMVRLEEKGGGNYQLLVPIKGGGVINTIDVPFADFKPAEDSKDKNRRLDLGEVQQLGFIDVSGIIGDAGGENTISLNNLRISP